MRTLTTASGFGVRRARAAWFTWAGRGVDVGGSKTLAAVADVAGRILGVGTAAGGNRQMVGADGFRKALDEAVDGALVEAGAGRGDLVALHVGASGLDFPEDGDELRAALGDDYSDAVVENDALLGLYAGTSAGWGGVVVGGSGTNAAAVAPDGTTLFVGGLGWHCGDSGGASMLGVEAQRLAIRSWEGREPATGLRALLVELDGAADMAEVFQRSRRSPARTPSRSRRWWRRQRAAGTSRARRLLETHGRDMGLAVGTALRRLGLGEMQPEVVGLGGMFPMCEGTRLVPRAGGRGSPARADGDRARARHRARRRRCRRCAAACRA